MKIDMKKRIKSLAWWLAVISTVILITNYFGVNLTKYIGVNWKNLVTLIFGLLSLLGITVDTSTDGFSDK